MLKKDGLLDEGDYSNDYNGEELTEVLLNLADIALTLADKGGAASEISRNLHVSAGKKASKEAKKEVVKEAVSEIGEKTLKKEVKEIIDDAALKHSTVGDFTINPKTGALSKMKGGGHGQANIDFLDKNGIEYNIIKEYPNGVRVGNVPSHKTKAKRTGINQSWFPKNWNETDIAIAGEYVGNLSANKNVPDGVIMFGEYNGVRVGIIRTKGKITTIFPDSSYQP